MRFEVQFPGGQPHEVELSGTVAVLGRDPSCDLVLNDARCSRRHAVIEAGPHGLAIRDAGSANGIQLNGQRVERAALQAGDVLRLGEVMLKVLPEEVAGTVVMAPEDLHAVEAPPKPGGTERTASVPPTPAVELQAGRGVSAPQPPAPPALPRVPSAPPPLVAAPYAPPPKAPPLPPPSRQVVPTPPRPQQTPGFAPHPPLPRVSTGPVPRPLTVTVLAILWMIGLLYYPLATVLGLGRTEGIGAGLVAVTGGLATIVSGLLAWGLWTRRPWARIGQIAFAILGLFTCFFTPASAAILAYLFRADVASHFADRRPEGPGAGEDGRLELYFSAAVAGLVLLPTLLGLLFSLLPAVAPALFPSRP